MKNLMYASLLLPSLFATTGYADTREPIWAIPGGQLLKDDFGHTFFQAAYPNYSLSRADIETGNRTWTIDYKNYNYFDVKCASADRIFLIVDKILQSVQVDSGQVLWSQTLPETEANPNLVPSLNCIDRSNDIYITYGEHHDQVRAYNKWSGATSWDYRLPFAEYGFLQGSDWQNAYLSQFIDGKLTLTALQLWDGKVRWQKSYDDNEFFFMDKQGYAYTQSGATAYRISPQDGSDLWSFTGKGSIFLDTAVTGKLYARDENRISRLDAETGRPLWSHDLPGTVGTTSSYAYLMPSGSMYVLKSDWVNHRYDVEAIDSESGAVRWNASTQEPASFTLLEDSKANLYFVKSKQLQAVDTATGVIRWTYDHLPLSAANAMESLMRVEGDGKHLVLTYGVAGVKYPPTGMINLDRATGLPLWSHFFGSIANIVQITDQKFL